MLHRLGLISATCILFLFASCGEAEKTEGLAGLVGTSWTGQYQVLKGGESSSPTQVSFSFFESNLFQTASLRDLSHVAKGEYKDMPRHNTVLLDVKESNFNAFSLKQSSMALEYSLVEDELILRNDGGIYTLVRSGQNGADPMNPFTGSWNCLDDQEGKWGVDLTGVSFFARRTVEGAKALSMSGAVSFGKSESDNDRPDIADVTITQSSQSGFAGIRLRARMDIKNTTDKFTMIETDVNGKAKNGSVTINCERV